MKGGPNLHPRRVPSPGVKPTASQLWSDAPTNGATPGRAQFLIPHRQSRYIILVSGVHSRDETLYNLPSDHIDKSHQYHSLECPESVFLRMVQINPALVEDLLGRYFFGEIEIER